MNRKHICTYKALFRGKTVMAVLYLLDDFFRMTISYNGREKDVEVCNYSEMNAQFCESIAELNLERNAPLAVSGDLWKEEAPEKEEKPEMAACRDEYGAKQRDYDVPDNSVLVVFADFAPYLYQYGAIRQDGEEQILRMDVHLGMIKDSVLISNPEGEDPYDLDIRYFPNISSLRFYGVSLPEGCAFYLENGGYRDLEIMTNYENYFSLHPGERIRYGREMTERAEREKEERIKNRVIIEKIEEESTDEEK